MQPFTTHHGLVVPIDRANVDTDAILPKQFMKSIARTGFGPHLFDGLRYLDVGEPGMDPSKRKLNPDFVLNQPRYQGASILLARQNFGSGSSREHAPWAIAQYGIRVLLAPSFADIFLENCFKNGLLPITLDEQVIDTLFNRVQQHEGFALYVDLQTQCITTSDQLQIQFQISQARRQALLDGLDEIGNTLTKAEAIRGFEAKHRAANPWLFDAPNIDAVTPAGGAAHAATHRA